MKTDERKKIEATLKYILYFVESPKEQENVLKLLEEYEAKMSDSKLKNKLDKFFLKFKDDYYKKVDFFISDILFDPLSEKDKKLIYELVDKLKPTIEVAKRTFLDKLRDLFSWS